MTVAVQEPTAKPIDRQPSIPPSESAPVFEDRHYRMTLDEYHRLAEAGILRDERVELIHGVLVAKMTKKQPHIIATALLEELLHRVLPAGWFVAMQDPVTIEESGSEPEPDAKIVRGAPRDYRDRRIGPKDLALVVEVSETSLRDDQGVKKAIYAQSSIACYWIVNLPANRLEVYTDPTGPDGRPDYRRRVDLGPNEHVPLILDGREVASIAVSDLLP